MLCPQLKAALETGSDTIDYDTIMTIHDIIRRARDPLPCKAEILARLIAKRNPDPRVDNIILIVAAVAVGDSAYPVENAQDLFGIILNQHHRLNTWVLAYVGDAIGKYPLDLPQGDRLADLLDDRVNYFMNYQSSPDYEFFGFHFLPPPRGDYIQTYLSRIADRRVRIFERNCYYILVGDSLPEYRIEAALRQVQVNGSPQTGAKSDRPLKYLVENWSLFFKDIRPEQVPRPDGL